MTHEKTLLQITPSFDGRFCGCPLPLSIRLLAGLHFKPALRRRFLFAADYREHDHPARRKGIVDVADHLQLAMFVIEGNPMMDIPRGALADGQGGR